MKTRSSGTAAATIAPALVAAVVGLYGITSPSLWRDESVSGMAARMSWADLRHLFGQIDMVHALYYVLLRPFAALGEPVELWLRLPSVLGMAATAYGVALLARRWAGTLAGVSAGLIYALLPIVSRYGQEARGYALVSGVAVLATWLLAEALDRRDQRDRRGLWWAAYGGSVALLGWMHLYALLLVPAHGVAAGRRVLPWMAAVAGAGVALLPLVAIAAGQRDTQLFWLKQPGIGDLAAFPLEVAGSVGGAVLVFGLAAVGAWAARRTPGVAAWAFLPVVLSWAISQVEPVYHSRYVLFAVPGLAVAAGIGIAWLAGLAPRWRPAVPAVALAALVGLSAGPHLALREPDSRPDDLRALTAALRADRRPGDHVLFVPQRYRLFAAIYGGPYTHLPDATHAPGSPTPRTGPELTAALRGVDRVWLVSPYIGPRYASDERLVALHKQFRPGPARAFGIVRLTLYTRGSSSGTSRDAGENT
ncbi:mannosyltransferase [Sinosporangium album]|uniref:Mannosyltransferase n=1 Tax=Sinosporangium album TaxID=504805 RepID=A0A1G7T4F6_9ACTN|nr:glycosyltransferase family 39 protein [Sinosporangium album]SDG30111.1 mannosyltransferase [Sinosporangium album]